MIIVIYLLYIIIKQMIIDRHINIMINNLNFLFNEYNLSITVYPNINNLIFQYSAILLTVSKTIYKNLKIQ